MKKRLIALGILTVGVFSFVSFILEQQGGSPNVYGLLGGGGGDRGEGESCSGQSYLWYNDNCGPGLTCKITEGSDIGKECDDKEYNPIACKCQKKACTQLRPTIEGESCSMGTGSCDGGFCVESPGGTTCECEYCGNGVYEPGKNEECESSIDGQGRCDSSCECKAGYIPDESGGCESQCDDPLVYYINDCVCTETIGSDIVCEEKTNGDIRKHGEACQHYINCLGDPVCLFGGDTCINCSKCEDGAEESECPDGCKEPCDTNEDNCVVLKEGTTAYHSLECVSGRCSAGIGDNGNTGGDGGPGPGPNSSANSSPPPSPGPPGPGPGGDDGGTSGDDSGDTGGFAPSFGSSSAGNTSPSSAQNSSASSGNTSAASQSSQSSNESNSSANSSDLSSSLSAISGQSSFSDVSNNSSLEGSDASGSSEFSSALSVNSGDSSQSSDASQLSDSSGFSSSTFSSETICGDGIVEGNEECDNGSICSQNIAMTCVEDIECRRCMLVNSIGRCGGTPSGTICISHEECEDEESVCEYNTGNDTCSDECRFIHSSESSFSTASIESSTSSLFTTSSFRSDQSTTSIASQSSSEYSVESSVSSNESEASTQSTQSSNASLDSSAESELSSESSSVEFGTSASIIIAGHSSSNTTLLAALYCGNGTLEGAEECDDGNLRNNDGCSSTCKRIPLVTGCRDNNDCSNGVCRNGDCTPCFAHNECGDAVCSNGACKAPTLVAAAPICGNGVLDNPEECDDRNTVSDDGCSAECLLEIGICGDGVIQKLLGEQCEIALHDKSLPYACEACQLVVHTCGDGITTAGEACDNGILNANAPDVCRPDCSLPRCGDGIQDSAEECDDNNRKDDDGCDRYCRIEREEETFIAAEITEAVPSAPAQVQGTYQPSQQYQFPQYPTQQAVPYQLPYAQLQPLIQSQGPVGDTGPAAVAVIGAGAASGLAWMRRKRK